MIWNSSIECASRKELAEIQLNRLKKTVAHVYNNVEFYRNRLDSVNVAPSDIKTLDDIKRIPFTTKEDLRQNYPYNLFAVPRKEVVRLHASSGTTGKPTVVGYTRKDIDMWSECMARLICMVGGTEDDTAQIAFGYGLFTGALGLHYGLEKVGASVIPISAGNTEKQINVMRDFGTTILVCTPSYALVISDVMKEMGVTPADLKLRIGMFGGEGHTVEMNREIEKRLGILATENYGLSEIVGPGVSGECYCKTGLHFNEDCFIPEIINPETGEQCRLEDEGELVITTIDKEAFPLLRYRTRDITSFDTAACKCGRTSARMMKVKGRSDDMLIIKGVNVYPSQVESVILGLEHISPHYQIVVEKKGYLDAISVHVELTDASLIEIYSDIEQLTNKVRSKLHSLLGIDCKVVLREPGQIERTTGKAKRVIDLR